MIEFLRIRNLALIDDMELEFSPGMNVLTGETGAGKSFILKALDFITGERLGANMVRPGNERAQVEAVFMLPEGELILRRELVAESGRSRFYINDALSSQDTVRELRPRLLLHTSQHGQQKLAQPSSQASLVDAWMHQPDLLEQRDNLVQRVRLARDRKRALLARSRELSDRRDLLELHLKEIQKVNPLPGEEEELERQRQLVRDAAQRLEHYNRALLVLHGEEGPGLLPLLGQLEKELDALTCLDTEFTPSLEAVSNAREVLNDLAQRLRTPPRQVDLSDTDAIESRLFALAQLKRKLHRTLPEILAMRDEINENLSFLDACELDIKQIEREEKEALGALNALVSTLDKEREKAAADFCHVLEKELIGLGFAKEVRVIPNMLPHEPVSGCTELKPQLLWAPNPGQHPQPLDRIASGGELSRFLLAVATLQAADETVTLVFDEVDAGVGGVTLNRVGERLAELAAKRQLLLITHWPQLAARASSHFQITKSVQHGETFTRCKKLDTDGRELELRRMAGIEG